MDRPDGRFRGTFHLKMAVALRAGPALRPPAIAFAWLWSEPAPVTLVVLLGTLHLLVLVGDDAIPIAAHPITAGPGFRESPGRARIGIELSSSAPVTSADPAAELGESAEKVSTMLSRTNKERSGDALTDDLWALAGQSTPS